MRVSANTINPYLQKELQSILHQVVADLKNPEEVEKFLKAFLPETEYMTLTKRLAIVYWLDKKRGYENIANNLMVSSATIASIQSKTQNTEGARLALQKIKAEEWANVWTQRIRKFIK